MAKVAYYEIHVDDFKRAQKFYHEVFGWEFSKYDAPMEYYMIKSGDEKEAGIDGGMLQRQQPLAKDNGVSSFVCTVSVEAIDEILSKVTEHGGTIAMPKMEMEGIGHVAYAIDTEGNTFGIWQQK
jgi:predicted enzyme related to lactoylglutathione lyase